MPKKQVSYRTFYFLPLLAGSVVFFSTVVATTISLNSDKSVSVVGHITVINHGRSQTPVIIAQLKNELTSLEVVGTKSADFINEIGHNFSFTGKLTGTSGRYGPRFDVISYVFKLK